MNYLTKPKNPTLEEYIEIEEKNILLTQMYNERKKYTAKLENENEDLRRDLGEEIAAKTSIQLAYDDMKKYYQEDEKNKVKLIKLYSKGYYWYMLHIEKMNKNIESGFDVEEEE